VFTLEFDRSCRADEVLAMLRSSGDRQVSTAIVLASHAERIAIAEQARSDVATYLADRETPLCMPPDWAIAVLVDLSGSMGDRLPALAGQLWALSDWLEGQGVQVALLGFTTSAWRGGEVRDLWIRKGCPPYPGRLAPLLHLAIKPFEEQAEKKDWHSLLMTALLKENIDGEALDWAASILAGRSEPRRALIVLSDGAPVDDATLAANGLGFLERHLIGTIRSIEASEAMDLAAIGLGHDVSRYYLTARRSDRPEDFVPAFLATLTELG
jgi:cobaltochelatase CobT